MEFTPLELDDLRQNFATLCRAIRAGDAALLQLNNDETHDSKMVICAVNRLPDAHYEYLPIAVLLDPLLPPLVLPLPPDSEGTWHSGMN